MFTSAQQLLQSEGSAGTEARAQGRPAHAAVGTQSSLLCRPGQASTVALLDYVSGYNSTHHPLPRARFLYSPS